MLVSLETSEFFVYHYNCYVLEMAHLCLLLSLRARSDHDAADLRVRFSHTHSMAVKCYCVKALN